MAFFAIKSQIATWVQILALHPGKQIAYSKTAQNPSLPHPQELSVVEFQVVVTSHHKEEKSILLVQELEGGAASRLELLPLILPLLVLVRSE